MENKKIVIGNQKIYMSVNEVGEFLKEITGKVLTSNVVICPTTLYIPYFLKHRYSVGIQNVCEYDVGQYTGEVSAQQASEIGLKYALVGHSERRSYYNEDNDVINSKIKNLLKANIIPVLCVGETSEEKNLFKTKKVLKSDLISCLNKVSSEDIEKIIIAYEPVWAIGTKRIPTMAEIKSNVAYIKDLIKQIYKKEIRVIYGGSVNPNNIEKLNRIDNVDGFLVGGSSTKAEEFLKIIEVVVNQ
ncbi:MAG: triose-phosphate isomerase [Firmicutes bacterium]|nr:triose-phosphate isomerase [Bacillota bacterium]